MAEDSQNEINRQIGRLRLVAVLGTGRFSTVYRATDTQLNRDVALKLVEPNVITGATVSQRVVDEARNLARLQHPNIVAIHDVGQTDEGRPYVAMDLLDGTVLTELSARSPQIPLREAAPILAQLASALDFLHSQGVVHGDLRPENIIISPNGTATLLDFSVSRVLATVRSTEQPTVPIGTPMYLAPEQLAGGTATPATDIYALGAIAYELLGGRLPARGNIGTGAQATSNAPLTPLGSLGPAVPSTAMRAIERAMASDPSARPPSATAFVSLLTGGQPTEVITTVAAPAAPAMYPPPAGVVVHRPYPWMLIAAIATVLIAAAVFALARANRQGSEQATPVAQQVALQESPTATAVATPAASAAASSSAPAAPAATQTPTPVAAIAPAGAPAIPAPPPPPAIPSAPGAAAPGTAAGSPGVQGQSGSAQSRIDAALRALPQPGASASYIDPAQNAEIANAGQTQVPGGSTLQLILAETVEQQLSQSRLTAAQPVAIQPSDIAQGSNSQIQSGQNVPLRTLLQAMLAGNDATAANALLRTAGGVNAVNQEASRLGLNQTRLAGAFSSSTTPQNAGNLTSAHDLATLLSDIVEHRGIGGTGADDLLALLQQRKQQAPEAMASGQAAGSLLAAIGATEPNLAVDAGVLELKNGQRAALGIALRSSSGTAAASAIANVANQIVQISGS